MGSTKELTNPLKLILHFTASWFTFLFLVFARSIEESLEQCIASRAFLETAGLYVIIGASDVNENMDKSILN